MKELMVYIYKLPIAESRPPMSLLLIGRWFYLKREGTLRFRHLMTYLSKSECPMVEHGRGYLLLKITPIREKLIMMAPDLVCDAIITPTKIEGIWEDLWSVEVVKADIKLLALWQIGRHSKANQKLKEVIGVYKKLLEELKKSKEGSKA
jgi:hypothetical protein